MKLAVSMQMEQSFTTPPPREVLILCIFDWQTTAKYFSSVLKILMEVAQSKNSIPLPSVKPHCGIRLPPDCYCLTACNYKLKAQKKVVAKPGGASAPGPRMNVLVGARTTIRPSSPAVRVTTSAGNSSTTPRPVVKVNVASATPAAPKIQIVVPSQPAPASSLLAVEKHEPENRGIKREREEDDDYDAA